MHSTLIAMTWEYWRKNRWWTFGLMLCLACIAALLYVSMHEHEAKELPFVLPTILLIVEFIGIGYFMLWAQYDSQIQCLGFDRLYYTQPISTFKLVTWQLLLRLVTGALLHTGVLLIVHLTGTYSSIPQMALIDLLLMIMCLNAVVWMFPDCKWLQKPLSLLIFLYLALGPVCFHIIKERSTLSIFNEMVTLLYYYKAAAFLCGSFLAWWAVTLDRRGSSFSLQQLISWRLNRIQNSIPYRSPLVAQFWFDFQRKGWMCAALNCILIALLWLLCAKGFILPRLLPTYMFFLAVLNFTIFPIILAVQLGQHGGNSFLMESYKATKPMTNATFIVCYLLVAAATLALAWVVYLVGLSATLLFTGIFKGIHDLRQNMGNLVDPIFYIKVAVATWTILGISASVMMAGRKWLAIVFWLGIWMVPLALSIIINGSPPTIREILTGCAIILALILGLGGTCLAYGVAWKKKMLHPGIVISAAVLFLICAIKMISNTQTLNDADLLIKITLLALPFAPLATAPLALAWNRHR